MYNANETRFKWKHLPSKTLARHGGPDPAGIEARPSWYAGGSA